MTGLILQEANSNDLSTAEIFGIAFAALIITASAVIVVIYVLKKGITVN